MSQSQSPTATPPARRFSSRRTLVGVAVFLVLAGWAVWRYYTLEPAPRWRVTLGPGEYYVALDERHGRVITTANPHGLLLRDLTSGRIVHTMLRDSSYGAGLAEYAKFSPDRKSWAVPITNGRLGIVNLQNLKERLAPFRNEEFHRYFFSMDSKRLILEEKKDGLSVTVIDLESNEKPASMKTKGHYLGALKGGEKIVCMEKLNDKQQVLTWYDVRKRQVVHQSPPFPVFKEGEGGITPIDGACRWVIFDRIQDGNTHAISIWDIKTNKPHMKLMKKLPPGCRWLRISPNGNYLAATYQRNKGKHDVFLANLATAKVHGPFKMHGRVVSTAFSADSSLLECHNFEGQLKIIETLTGRKILAQKREDTTIYSPWIDAKSRVVIIPHCNDNARTPPGMQIKRDLFDRATRTTTAIPPYNNAESLKLISDSRSKPRGLLVQTQKVHVTEWPLWMKQWLGLTESSYSTHHLSYFDLATKHDAEFLSFREEPTIRYSEEHQVLLIRHTSFGQRSLGCWDIPFGPPSWLNVLWLPLMVGLIIFLAYRIWVWRRRRLIRRLLRKSAARQPA